MGAEERDRGTPEHWRVTGLLSLSVLPISLTPHVYTARAQSCCAARLSVPPRQPGPGGAQGPPETWAVPAAMVWPQSEGSQAGGHLGDSEDRLKLSHVCDVTKLVTKAGLHSSNHSFPLSLQQDAHS